MLLWLPFALTACGGGGGAAGPGNNAGAEPSVGVIIDAPISGLRYATATQNGITDLNGRFNYIAGETVSFFVGGILIGSTPAKPLVTPLDFVPGATSIADPQVSNIVRFLITLDANNNPADGISITPQVSAAAAGLSLDFSLTTGFDAAANAVLAVLTNGAVTMLVSADAAAAHFSNTLLTLLAGNYHGTYTSAEDNGTWDLTVDASGNVTGLATSASQSVAIILSGTVEPTGTLLLSGGNTVFSIVGSIGLSGQVTGTWTDNVTGVSGSFAGTKMVTSGGGGAGSVEATSADFGTKTLAPTEQVVITNIGPLTVYSFNNDPPGWPATFTPNYDLLTLLLYTDSSTGDLVTVKFQYFNTGTDSLVIPAHYDYEITCAAGSPANPCNSISLDTAAGMATFANSILSPAPPSGVPGDSATANTTLNGGLNW
jgi:hypothetical protein